MYLLEYSSQFKKDFKNVAKLSVAEVVEVGRVIAKLQEGIPLDNRCVDHALTGNWAGFRDCHIKPDCMLIYRIQEQTLQLARIGSHSELFG